MIPSNFVQAQGQGAVSSDQINSFLQGCASVSTARGFVGLSGMTMYLQGFVSPGDGGQGPFYWNPSAPTGDDGGITSIQPVGVTTGAWIRLPFAVQRCISYVVNGNGSPLATGIAGDHFVPYSCAISAVSLIADQTGSVSVDIWSAPFATAPTVTNSIVGTDYPMLVSAERSQDATLSGWTKAIPANSSLRYNIRSAATITRLEIALTVFG